MGAEAFDVIHTWWAGCFRVLPRPHWGKPALAPPQGGPWEDTPVVPLSNLSP